MKDITDSMPDFLFFLFPLELLLQANVYYHCDPYGKRYKWFFLNLKKKKEIELNNKNKHEIARDVAIIEKFATIFDCRIIVSNGSDDIFKISDKINEENINIKAQISMKKMKIKRSSSMGLEIIKTQLGFS